MGKNVPRRHHYVPRFLLSKFTNDEGKLWTYDTEHQRSWSGIPVSTGFERDLYATNAKTDEHDFETVEKFLAAMIDGPGAEAIAGLLNQECLDPRRWVNFIGLVAAQWQRTPASFDRLTTIMAPTMQEMLERMPKFSPKFRKSVTESLIKAGATLEDIEEQFRIIELGGYRVRPHKQLVLIQSLCLIEKLHGELIKMNWCFLSVPTGASDLILGDHPVMLSDQGPDDQPSGPLGLRNPNIELVMPISKRMVAIANWTGPKSYGEVSADSVDVINDLTLRYARRFIFAPYESAVLLTRAVKFRGTGPRVHVRRVRIGKGLAIVKEYR